ncbi:S8 family serine peptidase [Alsobacter sp. SYSU BS001988]
MDILDKDALVQVAARGASDTGSIPLLSRSLWHLSAVGTSAKYDLNVKSVWADYTGKGVHVAVYDDGLDSAVRDLAKGYDATRQLAIGGAGDPTPTGVTQNHGTAVAGIIGASADGDEAVGVAYGARLTGVRIFDRTTSDLGALMNRESDFDVVNHSWRWTTPFQDAPSKPAWTSFFAGMAGAADNGRGGLGTIVVVAAGNERATGGDANNEGMSADRHVITVAAVTETGVVAPYSNPGASVLVSALSSGGSLRITTTDRAGAQGYSSGETTEFGGTSAAAPMVSGVAALLLEANPTLGWRDVQEILALTARHVGGAIGAAPSGAEESAWAVNAGKTSNGGGFHFSNDYGFGLVDAHAAVRLAETWTLSSTSANEASASALASTTALSAIPDGSGALTRSFTLAPGVSIERAVLDLGLTHTRMADVLVELVSPSGTVSKLLDHAAGGVSGVWEMSSNAFRGEDSGGVWTLRVSDASAGVTGTLSSAKLSVFGAAQSPDDVYVYTDDYADLARSNPARAVLTDASGHDSINAAAVASGSRIDLTPGAASTIAGQTLTIAAGVVIEDAVGGDGADVIVGNAAANILFGGRGDDVLRGGAGDDTLVGGPGSDMLDGGDGKDVAVFAGSSQDYVTARKADGSLVLTSHAGEADTLVSVERIVFTDATLALDTDTGTGQIYRLYQAALNRTPDAQGLSDWVKAADQGAALTSIAQGFVQSGEFQARYGAAISDSGFVTALYENVFERAPDQAGLQNWTGVLASGQSREAVLLAFSDSAEMKAKVAPQISEGIWLV